jgi:hypothetical protein
MVKHKACLFLVVILSTRLVESFVVGSIHITVVCSGSGSVSWYWFGSFVHPIQ